MFLNYKFFIILSETINIYSLSTYTMLASVCCPSLCAGGNWSTQRKPTWRSLWRHEHLTYSLR